MRCIEARGRKRFIDQEADCSIFTPASYIRQNLKGFEDKKTAEPSSAEKSDHIKSICVEQKKGDNKTDVNLMY